MTRTERGRSLRTIVAGIVGMLALSGAAYGQQVRWDDPGTLGAGQRAALDLVFTDAEPTGRITPPRIDGLTVLGAPSQQSTVSIINGAHTANQTLSFPVRAAREGRITVPAFQVETTAGTQTVAPLTIEVGAATLPSAGGRPAAKVSDVVDSRLAPSNMTPYAGEVFGVDQTISLTGGRSAQVTGTPSWNPGIAVESWGEGKQISTHAGSGVRFHTRAVAPQPGRLELAPTEQEVQVETGRAHADPFADFDGALGALRKKFGGADLLDSFFSQPQLTSVTAKSNAVQLDVQPLPQPAPAGFSGAVGQFEIETRTVPAQLKTGEPITWTIALKGTGNWPSVVLPARAVPAELRTLQPKQQKDFAAGELFSGAVSEDLVMIPNQPGDYRFDPVRFTYFDPATGQYRTIEAQPPVLHVTGAPIAPEPQRAPAAAAATLKSASDVGAAAPRAIDDTPLPHDPQRGTGTALTPLSARTVAALAGVPVLMLLAWWVVLLVRHARLTDPRRPQREALAHLPTILARVGAATAPEQRIDALLAWQRTAAVALGIDLAAPTAAQLPNPSWIDVWNGSERALYGSEHELPAGWCEHAAKVCRPARRQWLAPLRALAIRDLLPKAAPALLLLALAAAPARAADPIDAYAHGDFAAAREQLLARVTAAPSDWIARYNLGLAEAQLGEAPRALAETIAAFVRAPQDPDVRWNAAAFAPRVAGLDRSAAELVAHPGLPGALSPAAWQLVLIAAVAMCCAGAAVLLWRWYAGIGARRSPFALGALMIGTAGLVAAVTGLHAYGLLADPRAAIVATAPSLRSVPTDAEQPQRERPIAAGTVVLVDQDFLGWLRVDLRNGETGWLRHADLVPLYGAPHA